MAQNVQTMDSKENTPVLSRPSGADDPLRAPTMWAVSGFGGVSSAQAPAMPIGAATFDVCHVGVVLRVVLVGCVWWVWVWVLVESCIVDASIFVVKLLRAHGGCLGTRSR